MKNVIRLPLILPKDYEAFRALMKDNLPDTYAKWEELHQQQVSDCYRQGLVFTEVSINPGEFAAYCRTNGHQPKAITLRRFAREKPAGKA